MPLIPHSRPCLGPEEHEAVSRVLRSGRLAQGPEVEAFENACASYLGWRFGVAVSSGTCALHLALSALETPPGGKVAIPDYTCAALLTAVQMQGAHPVLVDCDFTGNAPGEWFPLDYAAAISVDLFGAPVQLPPGTAVIHDVAQSMRKQTQVPETPLMAVTSFYATKLITTGEGGMVFTDDGVLADVIRDRRDYDNRDDLKARYPYKMTEMSAAMGIEQLKKLPSFLARRKEIAGQYHAAFAGCPLQLPDPDGHAFFRYVIATPKRDALEAWLMARGIEAKRPVYRPGHHYLGGVFPGAEWAHQTLISLPVYPSMIDEEVRHVIDSVHAWMDAEG